MTMSTDRLGRLGEQVAVRHLRSLGWQIVDRNWRVAQEAVRGEIDVVAVDGATLVFCEVKSRRGTAGDALAAVHPRKQRQLRRLASLYLTLEAHADAVRFDVVAVSWVPGGGPARVTHVRAAF